MLARKKGVINLLNIEGLDIFAKRIRELREGQGFTTRMLAEKLGISNVAISYYENCKREPGLKTMKAYAKYFNTTLDYLCGFTDERYKKEV
jgi:transcriptional regulator with XRE-family HTH domain